ncbi:MAG: magnesium transporter CorA [Burkholderiales bacterium 35-55-47]|jgi:magnesium transporter|uniref:CorA family divalent cation transporter n=1 Tax=Limnohabitans sp. TaxID=1907725 RepID=UPI000BCCAA93|nr:CorA family divalent cation transporter [Limnohabitans sp.]OYY18753.1 MAG: magnesium transporter CorA [Burkholderiales bacterium 35-55-47]OYZ73571.1 MAG: magnesium transporter CorA [Burkholderiales bacterium 24-55-52]OZB00717.1 MAG: magnesium transporter CorA [Burkholderiales bacterium 39-55-53]HQR85528.1 CorA family divalent cation transporter [Limnohabitans sp.]HQS26555.1 CorA family divalent cation transporter [Limnohabitans sp.]
MSLQNLIEMLNKQKLVDGMVHSQAMPKQDVVATLLHKQHEVELLKFIAKQSTTELSSYLENLPLEDAQKIWHMIPPERENDVLWELSNERRAELAGDRQPDFEDSKVHVYALVEGRLKSLPISKRQDLDGAKPIWVDLINSSKAERLFIGAHFGVELPDPIEATDLEVSARFHIEENDDIHLHSNFLSDRDGASKSVPVAFILHDGILFSLRNEELAVFRLQRRRALTQPNYVTDSVDLLLDLYGADVEVSADSLENIYAKLGVVGRHVLSEAITDQEAASILSDIAEEEDQNGRIRSNILDTQRGLNFLMRGRLLTSDQISDAKQILRNIDSLNSHTAFLFDKINFLMDATIGFININQNKRVNQLTVFSVVFMPINILAGIGGMSEFSMMTEGTPWPMAYGSFFIGSALIGLATYVLLKKFEKRRFKKTD